MADFDLSALYKNQFGDGGQPLPTGQVPAANGQAIRCPVTFSYGGQSYTFQFEPMVSLQGRNVLIRNHPLKGRESGTVKEMWSADDYSIEIKGVVINENDDNRLPEEQLNAIRYFIELKRAIQVSSPYLTLFGITQMAIETYDFPHTKGYANQAYVIRGYSDKPFELF